jgi:hypothetical protein
MRLTSPLLFAAALLAAPATGLAAEKITAEFVKSFPAVQARQAVAVDGEHFYAINNHTIVKYEKATGKEVLTFEGGTEGPFTHLDSGVVVDGKLYAAHSNYPDWPMASSVEIFDAGTLQPVATYSFGIERGSLTWLDRDPRGNWWGAFANYNRVFDKSPLAYGNKFATQIVRFGPDWRVAEAWVLPDALVEKFGDMSNSGGSFGPDGRLYITGHDNAELYIVEPPKAGPVMRWTATIPLKIAGQGIAFDRSAPGTIYGVIRDKAGSQVTVSRLVRLD